MNGHPSPLLTPNVSGSPGDIVECGRDEVTYQDSFSAQIKLPGG